MTTAIPFIDLATQRDRIRAGLDRRLAAVLDHGAFIMGPEIAELESALCGFASSKHAIACGSGTDALMLPLMAWGIGPGDAVFCPSFTFASTAEVVALVGATPYFVDVEADTFNMDPAGLEAAIAEAKAAGDLIPRAIIAVDLFGQAANYPAIAAIARANGLKLISDTAQGFGSTFDGKPPSAFADVVSTSFFPAKPLGCYGDGGAVMTDDAELDGIMRSLRVHGQNREDKYDNARVGLNARMDTFQAAVLLEKLTIFPEEIELRNAVAMRYAEDLAGFAEPQTLRREATSVWAQYTIRLPGGVDRGAVQTHLSSEGVPTAIYYPRPLHRQTAYQHYPVAGGALPVSDALSRDVLSLPMHPYLSRDDQFRVVDRLRDALTT